MARAAGALLREYALEHRGLTSEAKSTPTDLVSAADRDSEALIRRRIVETYPNDRIVGEEEAQRVGTSGRTWTVDPLDGTTNFLFGIPQWGVSIACENADGGLAGCVYDPNRDELFAAARGSGAALNGEPVAVSDRTALSHALIGTGFNYDADVRRSQAAQLATIIGAVRDIRRAGAAALDLAWVACGRLDGFYEAGLGLWDWAAGSLLVTEAGGIVRVAPSPHGSQQVIAANPALAPELERLVTPER